MTASSSHAVLPLALVAGTMVLTAAACGGTPGQGSSPSGDGGATATVTATATATVTSSAEGTPTSSTSAGGEGACGVDQLKISYADDKGGGGAGSVTGTFTFTNTGTASCTLRGFPGVSYVGGGDGTQVGQAATRTDDDPTTKTLATGKSATAALRRTQPGNYGSSCQQTPVDGFRVYPPGSTESAFVAFPTTGCTSTSAPLLQVAPVR